MANDACSTCGSSKISGSCFFCDDKAQHDSFEHGSFDLFLDDMPTGSSASNVCVTDKKKTEQKKRTRSSKKKGGVRANVIAVDDDGDGDDGDDVDDDDEEEKRKGRKPAKKEVEPTVLAVQRQVLARNAGDEKAVLNVVTVSGADGAVRIMVVKTDLRDATKNWVRKPDVEKTSEVPFSKTNNAPLVKSLKQEKVDRSDPNRRIHVVKKTAHNGALVWLNLTRDWSLTPLTEYLANNPHLKDDGEYGLRQNFLQHPVCQNLMEIAKGNRYENRKQKALVEFIGIISTEMGNAFLVWLETLRPLLVMDWFFGHLTEEEDMKAIECMDRQTEKNLCYVRFSTRQRGKLVLVVTGNAVVCDDATAVVDYVQRNGLIGLPRKKCDKVFRKY